MFENGNLVKEIHSSFILFKYQPRDPEKMFLKFSFLGYPETLMRVLNERNTNWLLRIAMEIREITLLHFIKTYRSRLKEKIVWQKNNFVEKKHMRATSERLSHLIYSYIINNNNEIMLFYALI